MSSGWQRRFNQARQPLMLCVNASAKQIADTAFPARVAEIARRSGLAVGSLAVEITESVPMEEGARSHRHEQMDSLAADGIQVLIPPDAGKRKGARPGWQGGR
jgi:EAL domain-containing protein (putative c-di-GMP-specific phosphodiesterase class I)